MRGAATLLVVLLAAQAGCAPMRWQLLKSMRSEGRVNEAFPEVVWSEYECGGHKLPFFRVERNELVPPRLRPGGEFNHRMVYALCPERPTGVVPGRLQTRILFKGRPIFHETEGAYEILPGRWRIDTFVELPRDAETGIYAYEMEFQGSGVRFHETLTFLVAR